MEGEEGEAKIIEDWSGFILENNDLGNGVTFAVHGSSSDKDGFSIFRMIMQ